jgi:flagellar M-ring protein FliF
MNEKLQALVKQAKAFWDSLSTAKRVALIGVTTAVLALVLAVSFVGSRETYGYLFTELNAEDAQAIAAKLKELKIPYRIEAGGSAIQVPEERVHELRLELAGQGLPRGGGVGFELFDKSHLGATEFEQRIQHRRALEGELSRTIGNIAAVHSARVHLVLPERSVFALHKDTASASVVLRLRPGRNFGKAEIAGVVHLVASAVPGLTEDRVSVVSADGLTLHRPRTDGPSGVVGVASDLETEREREMAAAMEERARELLERTVGPGHADVRVNVELDSSARERTEERYDPAKSTLRSEQHTIEKNTTDERTVAGVPGAMSNLPDKDAESTEAETTAGLLRKSSTRNWEVDKVVEKTLTPAGRIARVTVAVLVDGTYGPNKEYVARNREELDRLGELVKGAVGFSDTRGDVLRIESAPFARVDDDVPAAPPAPLYARAPKWAYGALAGGVALAVIGVAVASRRRKKAKQIALKTATLSAPVVPAPLEGQMAPPELPPAEDADAERERIRAEALELAAKDPASAAVVLREWLSAPTMSQTPQF